MYPLGFSIPNYFQLEEIKFPKQVKVQISAFAENVRIYKNEEDFSKEKKNFAPYYLIPSGRFPVEEKRRAEAMFAGKIIMVKKMRNGFTWRNFYWMIVETYGTKIDVVCDSSLIKGKIAIGNIIDGSFWLSGKIIE